MPEEIILEEIIKELNELKRRVYELEIQNNLLKETYKKEMDIIKKTLDDQEFLNNKFDRNIVYYS
jgi:hypothetical protein